jgi:phosphatidate cytidylyltransferase
MGIACYLMTILYYIALFFEKDQFLMPIMVLYLLVILAIYVLAFSKYRDKDTMAAFLAFYYVSVCLSYVFRLRILENGGLLVILIFVCSWGNDTLAYCAGRLFGKHKMSPKLSPKKSIEGAVGGVVGAALLGVIYAACIGRFTNAGTMPILEYALIGAAGALISMVGDLAASAIKRNHEIKDYGKLIPGHGGIMDRFDSIIFTAPLIYILGVLLLGTVIL